MADDAPRVMITRDSILNELKRHNNELTYRYNVKQIGLFGSYARGEQNVGSDIDLLVDFLPGADLFDLNGLKLYLELVLDHRVDVVPIRALRDELRATVLADVTYV